MTSRAITHLEETGALLEGHFLLSSGLHSDRYVQCARVFEHPDRAEELCRELAQKVDGLNVDAVVGPAMGGVAIAYEMARAMGVRALFVERKGESFELRRFELTPGSRVIVAEDVVTTGGSAREAIEVLRGLDVEVVSVVSLVHRAEENPFDVPYHALVRIIPQVWAPEDCPLCATGSVAVKPGSRPDAGATAR